MRMKRKAQEEMVGFVLIVIIVAVVALVLLGLSSLNEEETIESSEVSSFLTSAMQYTTGCSKNSFSPNFSVRDLIKHCSEGKKCGGTEGCILLNSTLSDVLNGTWDAGNDRLYKGYELRITDDEGGELIGAIKGGNTTGNFRSKGSLERVNLGREPVNVEMKVYF